jgi:tetratricopeptide (TPR) repeat protein
MSYAHKGDYDRAIGSYTEAIRVNPKDVLAYRNRGRAYEAKGEIRKAEEDYAKARQLESMR